MAFALEIGFPENLLPDSYLVGEKALQERIAGLRSAMDYLAKKKRKWKEEAEFLMGYLEEIGASPPKRDM